MFLDALPAPAREILKRLGREPSVKPFSLAGGSAVDLHLGHRVSVDLDFFTPETTYAAEPLIQGLKTVGDLEVHQQSQGALIGTVAGVRLSFFVCPSPLLEKPLTQDGVRLASLLDLALMKNRRDRPARRKAGLRGSRFPLPAGTPA